MKFRALFLGPVSIFIAPLVVAQPDNRPSPPPMVQAIPAAPSPGLLPGLQQVYGRSSDTLIARQTADGILQRPGNPEAQNSRSPEASNRADSDPLEFRNSGLPI